MTADPVQVVAEALEDELIGEIEDFYGDEERREAPLLAARAVAALKANPDALAALLEPVGFGHRRSGRWALHPYDDRYTLTCEAFAETVYRLPDPS